MNDTEAKRQQALMAAILARGGREALQPWLAARPSGVVRGLQAYRANAGASAERSLASAFPTVQALVGEASFASLARAYWHAEPPVRGDLAQFGIGLPTFIGASDQLADVPYLADAARLDWLLAEAERSHDVEMVAESLQWLGEAEPARLRLLLKPGVGLLASDHPVVSLWKAHQLVEDAAAHRARARTMLDEGQGEAALVWREGWRARAEVLDAPSARWMRAVLDGDTLAGALQRAGEGFVFEAWLGEALQRQWLWRAVIADV